MESVSSQVLSIEDFLDRTDLEESPALEYVAGAVLRKPMPKFRHSILQKRLLEAITDPQDRYLSLPELRCTFGGRSIVPDIAVVSWDKVKINSLGEPEDNFDFPPDWLIEILSPDQSSNRVIDNLLHCLNYGAQLCWLVDPNDYSVLVLSSPQKLTICRDQQPLKVLSDLDLQLTAQEVFQWLQVKK